MKYLLTIFTVALLAFKSNPGLLSSLTATNTTIVGRWRLVSFDVPSPNDAGGVEVKLTENEAYELMTITDQNQFEFRTMGGTMTKRDNYGTIKIDKKSRNVLFFSEKFVGSLLTYVISKLTKTELEFKQQTRAGLLGRRYRKVNE